MKQIFTALLATCLLLLCTSCSFPSQNNTPMQSNRTTDAASGANETSNITQTNSPIEDEEEITVMYLSVNGNKLEVTLAQNTAVTALVNLLKQGDITYMADDYGGFEKVGSLGHTLPTENSQITAEAGDVILYQGNQIVLFYGSNSWSYTRLGKINGYSASELRTLLGAGAGSIPVRISLK